MNNKLKVIHVLWSGEIGGTEEYITSLVKYINPERYLISVCFLSEKGVIYEEALRTSRNIKFIGFSSGYDIASAIKLAVYLTRERFDIIHCHSTNILANLIISLQMRSKKIFSEHVSPGANTPIQKRKLFYRVFKDGYQKIVAISDAVKTKLIESFHVEPEKIEVVYNGIETAKYQGEFPLPRDLLRIKESNRTIIGFIGRMVDFKRPGLFIRIASELLKKNSNFHFIMAGDGPEMQQCRSMVRELDLEEHFSLLGFRRDIPNILNMFDAFLFTSEGEGFGIVIIEALAMGVPVFAINDGAVPEIIHYGKNGILFNTTDPEIIAQQIDEVIKDKNLVEQIKSQCAEDVRSRFSIDACARQMEKIYQTVL